MSTAPHSLLTLIKEMPIAVHLVDPPADTRVPCCSRCGEKRVEILRQCTVMQ